MGVLPALRTSLLLFLLLRSVAVVAQGPYLRGGEPINTRLLGDPTGQLRIEQLRAEQFRTPQEGKKLVGQAYYVWTQFRLENHRGQEQERVILPCLAADTVWVYLPTDSSGAAPELSAMHLHTGDAQDYHGLPSTSFTVYLPANSARTVTTRMYVRGSRLETYLATTRGFPLRAALNGRLVATAWYYFYTGLMVAITLLSLLVYRLLGDRSLLFFAGVPFSFALYFLVTNRMGGMLGLPPPTPAGVGSLQLAVTVTTIALTAFIGVFLRIPCNFPRYNYLIWGVVGLTILTRTVPYLLGVHVFTIVVLANGSTLVWALVLLAPVIRLAREGQAQARRLLISALLLAVPGVVYILQIILYHTFAGWLQVVVQLATLSFTAILVRALYRQVNEMRRTTRTLTEQTALRSRFFANISHEFRTPLTLILSPLQQLLERSAPDSTEHELLTLAHDNAQRQLRLVNRILELSKLQSDAAALRLGEVDLVPLVGHLTQSFQQLAGQRQVGLRYAVEVERLAVQVDAEKFSEIVTNLLSNALKFTPAGGRVTVRLTQLPEQVQLEVVDTGIGIAEASIAHVFDRYHSSISPLGIEGTGIGLSIVRELVRLHGGQITVESESGRGSTFRVVLPQRQTVADPAFEDPEYGLDEPEEEYPANRPTVLVVEDNDELRILLRITLQDDYHILEASHGRQAMAVTQHERVDLVVSDVMMPEMDGLELLQKLRNTLETSHIPVILLTARSGVDHRVSALEYGADDYVTKPFNHSVLRARIANLLEQRRTLQEYYARVGAPAITTLATTTVDEEFLARCVAEVERHLDDTNFRVADLATRLAMSPASLNRKLRGLLNQSTNQFIRAIRLRHAAELLRRGQHTVSEVGFATGFSSPTYFVRVFREQYGVTPGQYVQQATGPAG